MSLGVVECKDAATELYWGSRRAIWNNDRDAAYLYDASGEFGRFVWLAVK